jgi:hypothetical protein
MDGPGKGKNAIVSGTGNSGHADADDLYNGGAETSMVQLALHPQAD